MLRILQRWAKEFEVEVGVGRGREGMAAVDGSDLPVQTAISAAILSLGTLGFWKLFLKKGVSLLKICENLPIL